jgi:hypothetical protein
MIPAERAHAVALADTDPLQGRGELFGAPRDCSEFCAVDTIGMIAHHIAIRVNPGAVPEQHGQRQREILHGPKHAEKYITAANLL